MGPKTLPTIWGTYMTLVTKYQIPVINSCWEKCDEKCAYMINVYKDHLSRQTGSRNLTGQKTLSTIWYTYMMRVTKYQISAINSYWEKCNENILDGRKDGRTDRQTEVKRYTLSPFGERGYNYNVSLRSEYRDVPLRYLHKNDVYEVELKLESISWHLPGGLAFDKQNPGSYTAVIVCVVLLCA